MPQLTLENGVVTWLRTHAFSGANDQELQRTYTFAHPLNDDRALHRSAVSDVAGKESYLWAVRFFASSGVETTNGPVYRQYEPEIPFWGRSGSGKVVNNLVLLLPEEHQKQRFASRLYAAEAELYRRWGVAEVQMVAIEAGRSVWPRFGFRPKQAELIRNEFRLWWIETNADGPPPHNFSDYPEEFWFTLPEIDLFTCLT